MSEKHSFQAEVRQLLDIVIHSLYTDKEIFVRELVSNASDALEKLRHTQLTEKDVFDGSLPLEINITTDETAKTITIADYGIGMTREELVENLGTIAHSGTKQFIKALQESGQKNAGVIGQFGVGFYSAFMVAKAVRVYTHSWRESGEHLCWTSDGATGYEIEETPGQRRGCKIVIELKDDCEEFAKKERVRGILTRYSNFVPFPINLNGERINTVEAIWMKPKSEVTAEQYAEFYKFIGHDVDEPRYTMHFSADAPLAINALLFAPKENRELPGMGMLDPGVSLYCRKVLIDDSPKQLLPEWLRFLRGVVDSEDLPLNISRETMQDSALVQKLNRVIAKRFLKFLDGEAGKDAAAYAEFYGKFSRFLKEGICTDFEHREALGKLLRFESSAEEPGKQIGFADYVARMKDGQEAIYYLVGDSREAIESGPYIEAFKARGLEVLYLLEPIDQYVAASAGDFDGKKLEAADAADLDLSKFEPAPDAAEGEPLGADEVNALCGWLKESLGESVGAVRPGTRLVGSPAMALQPDGAMSPQLREMMKALGQGEAPAVKVDLEVNPRHGVIKGLAAAREASPEVASLAAQQILDNALLAAGLLDSPSALIKRGYAILEKALKG
ncbi:MAG: molecular chaperone HtpG [Verrucomicrobiales bacterium]